MIYWPESQGSALPTVGYNRAIGLAAKALSDVIVGDPKRAQARIYCNIPWHHDPKSLRVGDLPLIAWTMFESTRLPSAWRDFLNRHCDAIMVPTQHCRDMFRLSGITRPLAVVPFGVDRDEFGPVPHRKHAGYNFLWQGHTYDPDGRKGAAVAERAYRELCRDSRIGDDARLILKYRPHSNTPLEMDRIEVEPGITHVCGTLPADAMRDLMETTDCCINPSHGEGFGLIPLEHMAMGRPVILTGWSFPFLDPRYNIPIKYDLKPSPVMWCYPHVAWGPWGLEWNRGHGMEMHHLPRALKRVSNGAWEVGPGGKRDFVGRTWRATAWNALCDLQQRSGIYWRPGKPNEGGKICFESTGLDAHADVESLKDAMEKCYGNREKYRAMGARASEWALSTWGIERIRNEFFEALLAFRSEGII